MKKIVVLLLVMLLMMQAACGTTTPAEQTTEQPEAQKTAEQPEVEQTTEAVPEADAAMPQTAANPAPAGAVEMTDSTEILGNLWYFATGSADDSFAVNGLAVDATPVDAAGTIFKWSEADLTGQTVYGTVNVPYADFYYGELNAVEAVAGTVVDTGAGENETLDSYREVGMYDAVTSATQQKWKQQSGTYTQALTSGGQILGIADMCLAVDADLYVNASILSYLGVEVQTNLQAFVAELTVTESEAVVYKTLYADGTLSETIGTVTEEEGSFSLSSGGRYGDYELRASIGTVSGTLLGVVLVSDSGEYGLCHLENIWGNGRELAFYCFASDKTTTARFMPYEDLVGSTITQIRYITSNGVTVYDGLSITIG